MKRLFDVLVSLMGLLFFLPVLLIVAVAIKLDSRGPIFFYQKRVGLLGKEFKLIKFRTMHVLKGAERGRFDLGKTDRITSVGKILRKYKFDELPQLINILIGQMSIVGPRPEIKQWTQVYPERWKKAHSIKPGLTDYASVVFRNEEQMLSNSVNPHHTYKNDILPHKLDLIERYVDSQSFYADLVIIVKTIKAIILR